MEVMYMMHDIEANLEANKYYHAFLRVRSQGRSHGPEAIPMFPIMSPITFLNTIHVRILFMIHAQTRSMFDP